MKILICILLCFCSIAVFGQAKEISRNTVDAQSFKLDKLGNFYFVNQNVLTKTDKNLKVLFTWDNYSYGDISFVDVSDPLRILLYYADFNSLLFLDKYLTELRGPVSLDDIDIYNSGAIASAQQGGFWVYNYQNSQMARVDQNLNIAQKGVNLFSQMKDSEVSELLVSTDYIVLQSSSNVIIVLDKFANFYTKLQLKFETPISLDNEKLFYFEDTKLVIYNLLINRQFFIDINLDSVLDMEVSGDNLYILSEKSLITFEILY
ncbi:MAG: hypothetical protein PHE33_06735 [Bacteroidales bacterium]|nr:hypothetical protein [Bacteroidales bacterium]